MADQGSNPGQAEAGGDAPTVKDFLKKHVRGIPRDQMKRKVLYGFRYRDLKEFINEIISRHCGASSAELLAKISELEIRLAGESEARRSVEAEAEATAMRIGDLESAAKDDSAAAGARAENEALGEEIAGLKAALAASEAAASAASAEAAKVKGEFEALEKEAEFLDAEMEKLNGRNRQIEEQSAALLAELNLLKEKSAAEIAAAADRIAMLEGVVEKSKDMQKVLALENELKRTARALEAWEAAGEFMAVERVPDFDSADERAGAAIAALESRQGDARASGMAAALASARAELKEKKEAFGALVEAMYSWKGDFQTLFALAKASGQGGGLEARIGVLGGLAGEPGRS